MTAIVPAIAMVSNSFLLWHEMSPSSATANPLILIPGQKGPTDVAQLLPEVSLSLRPFSHSGNKTLMIIVD